MAKPALKFDSVFSQPQPEQAPEKKKAISFEEAIGPEVSAPPVLIEATGTALDALPGVVDAGLAGAADMGAMAVGAVKGIGAGVAAWRSGNSFVDTFSEEVGKGQQLYTPVTDAGKRIYDLVNGVMSAGLDWIGDAVANAPELTFDPVSGELVPVPGSSGKGANPLAGALAKGTAGAALAGYGMRKGLGQPELKAPAADAGNLAWTKYFREKYPNTFDPLKNSKVGKIEAMPGRSVWAELNRRLDDELTGDLQSREALTSGPKELSVREKMLMVIQKYDPENKIPQPTRDQMVERYLGLVMELDKVHLSAPKAAPKPRIKPKSTPAQIGKVVTEQEVGGKVDPTVTIDPQTRLVDDPTINLQEFQRKDIGNQDLKGRIEPGTGKTSSGIFEKESFASLEEKWTRMMRQWHDLRISGARLGGWAGNRNAAEMKALKERTDTLYTQVRKKFEEELPGMARKKVELDMGDMLAGLSQEWEHESREIAKQLEIAKQGGTAKLLPFNKGPGQPKGPGGRQGGMFELEPEKLALAAQQLKRTLDDPILPFVVTGLAKPYGKEGAVKVYRPIGAVPGEQGYAKEFARIDAEKIKIESAWKALEGSTSNPSILGEAKKSYDRNLAELEGRRADIMTEYTDALSHNKQIWPADWVSTNPEVAADYSRQQGAPGAGAIISQTVDGAHLFKIHPEGYVYAPPGTIIDELPRFIDDKGRQVTMGDLLKVQRTPGTAGESRQAYQKVSNVYGDAERAAEVADKKRIKTAISHVNTKLLDFSADVKKKLFDEGGIEGRNAVREFELISGQGAIASRRYRQEAGRVFDGLSKDDEVQLNRIANAMRISEIDKYKGVGKVKHMGGLTGAEAESYLTELKREIGADRYERLRGRAGALFDAYRSQLAELRDEGIITPESYKKMYQFDYQPRRWVEEFFEDLDPSTNVVRDGRTVSVRESGIQDLKKGSKDFQVMDSRALLSETISRAQGRIAKNRAAKALLEFARAHPDNSFVRAIEVDEHSPRGELINAPHIPRGMKRIDARVAGQIQPMYMDSLMADQWVNNPRFMSANVETMLRWASGTAWVRPMATTIEPAFAPVNLMRDMMQAWFATDAYSPHMPIAGVQLATDYIQTARAAWGRGTKAGNKEMIDEYYANGGGTNVLAREGRNLLDPDPYLPKVLQDRKHFEDVKNVMSFISESSEMWTRLSVANRLKKQGMDPRDATWQARRYLDYSQGGEVVKALDTVYPFLNANVQALRGVGRQAKADPGGTAIKAGWLISTVGGIQLANMLQYPDAWKETPTSDKVGKVVIHTGKYIINDRGDKQWLYVTLPIDSYAIPFAALTNSIGEKMLFGKVPDDTTRKTISQMGAATPFGSEVPIPTIAAAATYGANHNFWTDDKVWKGKDVSPFMEYVQGGKSPTPEFFKQFGSATGMSPERSRAAMNAMVPNNTYTTLTGLAYNQMFGKVDPATESLTSLEVLTKAPGASRVLKLTHPANKDIMEIEALNRAHNDKEKVQNDSIKGILDSNRVAFKGSPSSQSFKDALKKVQQYVSTQPPGDQERLTHATIHTVATDQIFRRFKEDLSDVPSKGWWQETRGLPADVKAELFYSRWVSASPEARTRMVSIASAFKEFGIPYTSDEFFTKFGSLQNERGATRR